MNVIDDFITMLRDLVKGIAMNNAAVYQSEIIITSEDGTKRLTFPFFWRDQGRAFTYASIDGVGPTIETWTGRGWRKERMDLDTFTNWMQKLESLEGFDPGDE